MMTKKTRNTIWMISVLMVVLIIAMVVLLVYMKTDIFQSNASLFMKYLGQNVTNVESMYQNIGKRKYQKILQQNKYTTDTQLKINFTEQIGTTSESTQNPINQLKIQALGQIDPKNEYHYQDIRLMDHGEEIAKVEYIQNGTTLGLRFSDFFNQYVLAENENLKDLIGKMGYTEEELANVPDKLEWNLNLGTFQFSEEEKQNLKTKYTNIIYSNVSKQNFSKQKNQTIQIEGKNVQANAYTLTLTKEQLNNIYIKILEELKQDETILAKIGTIQELIADNYLEGYGTDLQAEFIEKVEQTIRDIIKNNIGQDEVKIIVYENNHFTVKTLIQTPEYEISFDVLRNQGEEYLQFLYQDITTGQGKTKQFTYQKTEEEMNLVFQEEQNETITEYSLEMKEEQIKEDQYRYQIVARFEDNTNRVEASMDQNIELVNQWEDQTILKEENSIQLNELEETQIKTIEKRISEKVSTKINEITTNVIKPEDFWKVFSAIGIMQEELMLETTGVTETERNRFNSKFEILQGENLDAEATLKLIDAIKENLIGLEVVSNTELKLKLDRSNYNEEAATTIKTFIEKDKSRKYNAKVEYDETTGLISDIRLTIVQKQ